jgi:Ca2+-binding RTX toxin-like protein
MARSYNGTNNDDAVSGFLYDENVFTNFGIGYDKVTGGYYNDTFKLLVDERTDTIDGGKGEDCVDYSGSDRGLTIDLSAGKVTALFGGGLTEIVHYATVANLIGIEDAIGSKFNDTLTGNGTNNILEGGAGADKIDGGYGIDTVSYAHSAAGVQVNLNNTVQHGGDAENDQLYNMENIIGSGQADNLVGRWAGDNVIEGGGGGDYLSGGGSQSQTVVINGTTVYGYHIHENTVSYAHSSAGVLVNLSQVTQHYGDAEGDQLYYFGNVLGSAYGDQITGNAANNHLDGAAGDDTFNYSGGYDWIDGGAGHNTYVVGQLPGTAGVEIEIDVPTNEWQYTPSPVGGAGSFTPLVGSFVYYSGGYDFLTHVENYVGSQNGDNIDGSNVSSDIGVTIDGAGGDDYITGSAGTDYLRGGGDNDTLWGGGSDDFLYGGSGDDYLYGDDGNDSLRGDDNDDWLTGGAGADTLSGGAGTDTADYSGSLAGVTVQLERPGWGGYYSSHFGTGSGGDAEGDTLTSVENVMGSSHDDKLVGDSYDNVLVGGAGNNTLIGGGGNDTLVGGQGDDVMTGAGGQVAGASDADTFFFQLYSESGPGKIGNDTITDYQPGTDQIELANLGSHAVHVAQDQDNAVMTIDGVVGSITVLNTHAADVHWMV